MDFLINWWGEKDGIGAGETVLRGIAMFVFFLAVIRFTGMRSFSKGSVFDNLVIILLGAVLGRGITGGTPFFSALLSGLAIVIVHKLIARITFHSQWAGRRLKGTATILYHDGKFLYEAMKKSDITQHDIMEELRITCQCKTLDDYCEVRMERSGKLSFIKRTDEP